MACEPFAALGEYLTAGEAEGLASLLEAGEHSVHALAGVSPSRRGQVAELIKQAGLGHEQPALSVAVLRASKAAIRSRISVGGSSSNASVLRGLRGRTGLGSGAMATISGVSCSGSSGITIRKHTSR